MFECIHMYAHLYVYACVYMYTWVHIYVSKNFSSTIILLDINPTPPHFTSTETDIVMDHITMLYGMMVVI